MSHMGNLKLNQPANLIFSGDDKNKALNNIKFRENLEKRKFRTDTEIFTGLTFQNSPLLS